MRIHHFVYTFLFVLAYILFTVVYWAAGGQNHRGENFIYSLLDYSGHPGRAVLVVFAVDFVGTPLLQIVLYALFRFCLLYTSPSPRDMTISRMPSSA